MRIVVITVGRLRAPYADAVEHYSKLLARHVRLEQVELREASPERVAARVPTGAFVSLLAADGEVFDSPGFARFVEARRASGRDLAFVIGGAFGLELADAEHRLSFGPMTLPHQLARVVLLEALFRAHTIIAGTPYHH